LKNNEALTDTGLPAVGRVPWGSHFCIFFESKTDLLDILVPFFKAGLEQNEFCLWVVGGVEFVTIKAAKEALAKGIPKLEDFLEKGNIQIQTHKQLFGTHGRLDAKTAIARLRKKATGIAKRFVGLRCNCGPGMRLTLKTGRFREFEHEIDVLLTGHPVIAMCTFPLTLSGAKEILDAARTHQFAVTVRKGVWKRVEVADIDAAVREANPNLDQLTFRQREILQHIAEGLSTKQIAALLRISVKTVEAHRLRLMRRLKIDNVPGLVRFAIRTGLVSAVA
jgi:DNA-binding CsgD family transcriptional regulator